MGAAVAIGTTTRVRGWSLAGVRLVPAEGRGQVEQAWSTLPGDVTLVIVTPEAAAALEGRREPPGRVRVVMP